MSRDCEIKIPPKSVRQKGPKSRHQGKIKIVVDRIVFDDSQLVIDTDKPDKDPKVFALKHIALRNVSQDSPSPYDATLTNAIPTGDIHAVGTFGPWNPESPGDSAVTGNYTFQHADFKHHQGNWRHTPFRRGVHRPPQQDRSARNSGCAGFQP